MKKIRIGMFSWESLHSIRVGGVACHVPELSDALAAEGHEVHSLPEPMKTMTNHQWGSLSQDCL